MSNHLTVKHRATEPLPVTERAGNAGTHRGRRTTGLPVAGILGVLVILVAVVLAIWA